MSVKMKWHFNNTDMIQRSLTPDLLKMLHFYPAVGLIGPRQVGKTTLALSLKDQIDRPVRYFDLERLEDYQRLNTDPGFFLEQYRDECVIIDEVQRLPGLFAELRSLIDRHRVPGRFLLLGSASPLLLRHTSDSLAGRIGYLTLHGLHFSEIAENGKEELMKQHWWRGGFPDAWLAPSDDLSFNWRENFTRTYVERDLQFLGLNADPIRLRTFLQMLAAVHGNLWNAEALGRSLGISGNTVKNYLYFLESSFFVRVLHPYFTNAGKRLIKSPKVYIQDSGLLHTLLGIRRPDDLPISPTVGASWEGYAIDQILEVLPPGIDAFFYRTSDGTECDLVLVRALVPFACIEIKLGNTTGATKGLRSTIETLGTVQNFILTYNSDTYNISGGIQVMNLRMFISQLPQLLAN